MTFVGLKIPSSYGTRNLCPVIAHIGLKGNQQLLFLSGPWRVFDAIIKVVVVPFSALFAGSSRYAEFFGHDPGNEGPFVEIAFFD